jgi:hypothetical protein
MKEISFGIGDKIVSIKDGELRKGVIKNFYPMVTPPVFAVEFEDGSVEKVLYNNVAKEPETETQEENEPIQKSEITITPDEFQEIACRVIIETSRNNTRAASAFTRLIGRLHKALFVEPWEND